MHIKGLMNVLFRALVRFLMNCFIDIYYAEHSSFDISFSCF